MCVVRTGLSSSGWNELSILPHNGRHSSLLLATASTQTHCSMASCRFRSIYSCFQLLPCGSVSQFFQRPAARRCQ